MMVSVRFALGRVGSRNAGTPLRTASTPVIAVQPLANARISSQRPLRRADACSAGGADDRRRVRRRTSACGRAPDDSRRRGDATKR